MKREIECDECERAWPVVSEQAACIILFGQCIVCRKDTLTDEDNARLQQFVRDVRSCPPR